MFFKLFVFMILSSLSFTLKVQFYKVQYCETAENEIVFVGNNLNSTAVGKFAIVHVTLQILKEIYDPVEVYEHFSIAFLINYSINY